MEQKSVLLYAAAVTPLEDPEALALAYGLVSPARRQTAEALRPPAARRRCLAAGLLLRHALATLGVGPAEPVIDRYGKPWLPGGPAFSLSHSGDYVLCAVADRDVGCDVQRIGDFHDRLARRCLTQAEYADVLAQADPGARALRFYRYWTLKESFIKAIGLGLRLPLREVDISLGPPLALRQQIDGRPFGLAEFDALPGYRCALCAAEGCGDVALELIPLPLK